MAKFFLENIKSRFSFYCGLSKCDKMQHRLNFTPGLNILLNSKGNLMGFTVMLLRVLKSQRCCLLHSWRREHAAELAAVLEATGLRI